MSEEEKQLPPKKSVIKLGTFTQPGKGDLQIRTFHKTRWERFVNLILLPWRYVWHGRFKL